MRIQFKKFKRKIGRKRYQVLYGKKFVGATVVAILMGITSIGMIKAGSYNKVESATIPGVESVEPVTGKNSADEEHVSKTYEMVDRTEYIEYEVPVKKEKEITDIDMNATRQLNLENIMEDLTEETNSEG